MEVLNFENFNGWKLTEGKSCIQLILGTTILGRKTSFFLSFSLSLNFQKKKKKTEQLYLNFLVCHGFVLSVAIFNFFLNFLKTLIRKKNRKKDVILIFSFFLNSILNTDLMQTSCWRS